MNLNDFLAFVEFVKDVDKYESRVKALKEENDRLETNIGLTAKIADIPRVKELTEQKLEEARQILANAKVEAASMKEKAKTTYDKQLADLQSKSAAADQKLAEGTKSLAEAKEMHSTLIAEAKTQLAELEKKQVALSVAQQEVNERLEKLKSVMG